LAASRWNVIRQRLKKMIKYQQDIQNRYQKRVLVDEIFSDIKPVGQVWNSVEYLTYQEVLKLIL